MDIKTLRAVFTGGSYCKTRPLTRQDYGITLQFVHPDLPETYQVHFSNSKENTGTAKTQIATADGVTIPDEYLIPGKSVYAWAFLQADGAGRSRCMVEIPVAAKPTVTDAPPTPQQRSAIDEAIEALNDGVERVEGAKTEAEEFTEDSEAWAVGKRGGVDVPPTDPTYHNNAKYWAGEAHTAAPVTSVNGKTGAVTLNAEDVGALPAGSTLDYYGLANKPQINGVELVGNKSFEDLGEETITNAELQEIIEQQYSMIFGGT